jgi:hypothetical protein
LRKDAPTFDLWQFAARYTLLELERYCRNNPAVLAKIKEILCDKTKGIGYFLNASIPLSVLNPLVTDMITERNVKIPSRCSWCNSYIPPQACKNCVAEAPAAILF